MKLVRIVTQNMKHTCSTPVTTEQYLWEQIKKGTGKLEDIFMQTVPVEQNRVPRSYTADPRAHVDDEKTTMSDREKKRSYFPH